MSLEVRPSKLIEWARCQLRAQHRTVHPTYKDRDPVTHIAAWLGSEAHARLAERESSNVPPHAAFDTITPNRHTALLQVERIVETVRSEMVARCWRDQKYEVEVGTEQPFQGTLDLFFDGRHDPTVGGWAIADFKTGQSQRRSVAPTRRLHERHRGKLPYMGNHGREGGFDPRSANLAVRGAKVRGDHPKRREVQGGREAARRYRVQCRPRGLDTRTDAGTPL